MPQNVHHSVIYGGTSKSIMEVFKYIVVLTVLLLKIKAITAADQTHEVKEQTTLPTENNPLEDLILNQNEDRSSSDTMSRVKRQFGYGYYPYYRRPYYPLPVPIPIIVGGGIGFGGRGFGGRGFGGRGFGGRGFGGRGFGGSGFGGRGFGGRGFGGRGFGGRGFGGSGFGGRGFGGFGGRGGFGGGRGGRG